MESMYYRRSKVLLIPCEAPDYSNVKSKTLISKMFYLLKKRKVNHDLKACALCGGAKGTRLSEGTVLHSMNLGGVLTSFLNSGPHFQQPGS